MGTEELGMYRISVAIRLSSPFFTIWYPVCYSIIRYPAGYRIIALLAVTSSSRNTPWLLLFLLKIMMMLPLIMNSYNLVNFHWNFMKLDLNYRISHCLSFTWNIFLIFFLIWFNVLVDLEKFLPWYLRSELWSPKTSSFMHGWSWNWL